jgi:NAD(P)-dependent dehydrogenase (short-subunit alcohol dehydrogenase family)
LLSSPAAPVAWPGTGTPIRRGRRGRRVGDHQHDVGKALVTELGPSTVFVDLDVTDPDQWSAAVAAVSDRWGRIEVFSSTFS